MTTATELYSTLWEDYAVERKKIKARFQRDKATYRQAVSLVEQGQPAWGTGDVDALQEDYDSFFAAAEERRELRENMPGYATRIRGTTEDFNAWFATLSEENQLLWHSSIAEETELRKATHALNAFLQYADTKQPEAVVAYGNLLKEYPELLGYPAEPEEVEEVVKPAERPEAVGPPVEIPYTPTFEELEAPVTPPKFPYTPSFEDLAEQTKQFFSPGIKEIEIAGKSVSLEIRPDYSVWIEDEKVGDVITDQFTGIFSIEPTKVPLVEPTEMEALLEEATKIAYPSLEEKLEAVSMPFAFSGQVLAMPFIAKEELAVFTPEQLFRAGKIQEKYEKLALWQQIVAELPSYIASGGIGTRAGIKLFQQAAKIETKRLAGKVLTKAEIKILDKATIIESKISWQIAKAPRAGDIPTIAELIGANFDATIAARLGQKLVKAPGIMGSVNRSLLPMQAAKTDAERAVIAWMALKNDIAPSLARIEMDAVIAKDFPFKFAAPLYQKGTLPIKPVVEGIVKNVKPIKPEHKPFIQAIAEFPDRYILTATQRAELDLLDDILRKQLAKEIVAGVNVKPVGLREGQRYFPRFIKELEDLQTKAITEVRRGVGTRPGVRPSSFRTRYYEEVLEGIVQGKKYATDLRAAVEMRITAGNKAIADKQLADFLRPLGQLPKERVSLAVRTVREEVVARRLALRNISSLIEQINAKAPIGWPYWLGIKRWYPKEYAQLRIIAKQGKQVSQKLKTWIVDEKVALKAKSRDINIKYKLALARAKVNVLGKEGIINHAGLQGEIFPIEISSSVNALITKEITSHQVLSQIAKINDVARMGQTAIDTGFTLIQGLMVLANNPSAWGKAFVNCLKTLVNPKYVARWNTIPKHMATRRIIATHGGAPYGGSEFTLAARAGGWLAQIPVVGRIFRRFGRVFEDYLDTARTLLVEGKLPHYTRKLGRQLTDKELTDLVVTCDHMVGISSMARLGMSKFLQVLARDTMYAPRYYLAFASFLGRAFQGGIGGDIARQGIVKLMIAAPAFMSAMALALGQEERIIPTKDKPIPKMFDPRTGELMTVEIAGVHMGLGGVWIAGFRLLGSLVRTAQDDPMDFLSIDPHEQPLLRYSYGRAAPVVSAAIDVITGKNYLGERLDSIDAYLKEIVDKTFPFWLAGQITDVPKAGWQKGFAEWWGLRAWMVQYREQARDYAETHIKDIPEDIIMPWQKEKLAAGEKLTYDDLNNEQMGWLLLTFEDYREAKDKVKEDVLRRGTDFQVMDAYIREELGAVYFFELEELANGFWAGASTIEDYVEGAEYQRRIRQGQYQRRALEEKYMDEERIEDLEAWLVENESPEDVAYDKYMELRGDVPKKFGVPDWDKWQENLDTYLNTLDKETQEYINRRRDDWIDKLPPATQKVERLLLICEEVLEDYYEQPSDLRLNYRKVNPDTDVKLNLLGRATTIRSKNALVSLRQWADTWGIPYTVLPALVKEGLATVEKGEAEIEQEERQKTEKVTSLVATKAVANLIAEDPTLADAIRSGNFTAEQRRTLVTFYTKLYEEPAVGKEFEEWLRDVLPLVLG